MSYSSAIEKAMELLDEALLAAEEKEPNVDIIKPLAQAKGVISALSDVFASRDGRDRLVDLLEQQAAEGAEWIKEEQAKSKMKKI